MYIVHTCGEEGCLCVKMTHNVDSLRVCVMLIVVIVVIFGIVTIIMSGHEK